MIPDILKSLYINDDLSLILKATLGNLKGDHQKNSRPVCFHRTKYTEELPAENGSDVGVAYSRQTELWEGG